MFSVSTELYEILSLAFRYVFALFGVLIVLRAFHWLLQDRQERHRQLRLLPDAGMVGELVVLSGSRELPENAYLPVPREGCLGFTRSNDLPVPCDGVRQTHLDFSWQDGVGLLLHPRSGCEVWVDGTALTCHSSPAAAPLRHGSVLQVGSAVLRLFLFSTMAPADVRDNGSQTTPPEMMSLPREPEGHFANSGLFYSPIDLPVSSDVPPMPIPPQDMVIPEEPVSTPFQENTPVPASDPGISQDGFRRRRRSDRWKEDWSE